MEERNDLADVLLNGLPEDERTRTQESIRRATADKLTRVRATDYEVSPKVFNRARQSRALGQSSARAGLVRRHAFDPLPLTFVAQDRATRSTC